MRRDSDFQLYERVEENLQRKKRHLRWGLFGLNLICFLMYSGFVILAMNDEFASSYLMSVFRDVARMASHVLWIPILIWMFTLIIHFISVLIESGRFDKRLAARAQAEEERIIETILHRLSDAEKRKRDTSHLDVEGIIETHDDLASRIADKTHQYRAR